MEFLRRAEGEPSKLGIFPGAFHPPTRAHLGIATAALAFVDEVVFVMPRAFPHKEYDAVGIEERLSLLAVAAGGQPRFSITVSAGGLFVEIARECRAAYGPGPELWILCGRDAAERIVNWDYGEAGAFDNMIREFGLLVAPRGGEHYVSEELAGRLRHLSVEEDYSGISSTEVRNRLERGQHWEHLVPPAIVEAVRQLYG